MNIERLTQLRDTIATLPPHRFKMNVWSSSLDNGVDLWGEPNGVIVHDCGTCACIGGWADALFLPENIKADTSPQHTGAMLGLSEEEANELFMPDDVVWEKVTQADAVTVLTKLIETGEVDWSHVS
jgi:hypothetical protein